MEHFFPQIRVKTKKKKNKKVFTKKGTLFSPEFKWTPTLRCTPESNYWGNTDVHHTVLKLLGGYSQIIGGDISPTPPGFGTSVGNERLLVPYC